MFKKNLGRNLTLLLIIVFLVLVASDVFAASDAGGDLPYEEWLTKVVKSVTGPVAFTFAIIGIVVAGAVLIFGGDLNGFFRTFLLIVLVIAFIIGAQNIMSGLFGRGAILYSAEINLIQCLLVFRG